MKKLVHIMILIAIQHLAINIQNSYAQAPNDNRGSGNCLEFDGVNDFLNVPDHANWTFGTADFTVSLWVRFNDITDQNQGLLLHAVDGTSGSNGWAMVYNSSDGINFYTGTSGGLNGIFGSGAWTPQLNTWMHLAVVRSGNNWTIYENGIAIRSATKSVNIGNANTTLRIGQGITYSSGNIWSGSTAFFYNGQIDEVRIWNTARTQAQIQDNMSITLQGNETGLIGYWNMNEGTGGTAADLTSNGNNGTLQ